VQCSSSCARRRKSPTRGTLSVLSRLRLSTDIYCSNWLPGRPARWQALRCLMHTSRPYSAAVSASVVGCPTGGLLSLVNSTIPPCFWTAADEAANNNKFCQRRNLDSVCAGRHRPISAFYWPTLRNLLPTTAGRVAAGSERNLLQSWFYSTAKETRYR